jgi:8-oxo-dGTP diphosphatase
MGRLDQGVQSAARRYQVIPRVLIFLRHGDDVLLIKGAANKRIWANRYNGVGGHVEAGEDVLAAARREASEETGLAADNLRLAAVVNVDAGDPTTGIMLFVFTGWSESRATVASVEGELEWVHTAAINTLPLVEDLPWLLPHVLALPPSAPPLFVHYSYDQADRLVIHASDAPTPTISP